MNRYLLSGRCGIGGWLMLFQVRLYVGIAALLALEANTILSIAFVIMLALCLILFYVRCIAFRDAYIIVALLGVIVSAAALPIGLPFLIAQLVLEAAIIPALYRSRRVKAAFFRCRGSVEHCSKNADQRDRSCYDVYLAAFRCGR